MNQQRLDTLVSIFDAGLRTVFSQAQTSRPRPASSQKENPLTEAEKKKSAALMRVNHVGEVCAQALYSGQTLFARDPQNAQALKQASKDEVDHLAWCESRIVELGGRKSLLNPLWYAGSFGLGVTASILGERWNLGFLAETERQVSEHLEGHLHQLPEQDTSSRAIVAQMKEDEEGHARLARTLGGAPLPKAVQVGMQLASKVMTATAYYV